MAMEINIEKTAQGVAEVTNLVNTRPIEMLEEVAAVVKNLEGQSDIQEALLEGCRKFEEGYNNTLPVLEKYVGVLKDQVPELDKAISKIGASLDIIKPGTLDVKTKDLDFDKMPVL